MVQSNVIVTYAPARRAQAPAPDRPARGKQPRWGMTLAGALLAGGAVFAIGQFVRPDGSLRQTTLPASTPLASAGRITIPPVAPPSVETEAASPEPAPLPYLAFVRETPPSPPLRRKHELSARSTRESAPAAPRASLHAALDPTAASRDPPAEIGLPPSPPAPPPVAGPRRDLEGFLTEQGLVLAAPTPEVSGEAPVSEWSEEELAPPPSQDPAGAAALGASAAPAPATASEPVLELTESDALPTPAAPAETPGKETANATADLQEFEPLTESLPPVPGARAVQLDQPTTLSKAAPSAAPAAASAKPAMSEAPAAAYVQLFPTAVVNGQALGAVTMRDLGAEGMAVHLGGLVGLLKLRMPQAEFERLSNAAEADQFVTLEQLRNAGINAQFNARAGRLLIEAR